MKIHLIVVIILNMDKQVELLVTALNYIVKEAGLGLQQER